MLYPTKPQCWIHELFRAVFRSLSRFVPYFAIFFIYLLIIYPACPARGKKSDDSTCTSHRFFFLSAKDASRAERSRVSEILRLLQKASPPVTLRWARGREGCFESPLPASGLHPPRNEKGAARPFQTPKLLGSIQKIQVAPLKDFLCSADSKAPQSLRDSSPQGSERQQMQLLATVLSHEKANQE